MFVLTNVIVEKFSCRPIWVIVVCVCALWVYIFISHCQFFLHCYVVNKRQHNHSLKPQSKKQIRNKLESVQLRKHCNSKAARLRAGRFGFGVLSALSGFSAFFCSKMLCFRASWEVPPSNYPRARGAIIRLHVLLKRQTSRRFK